MFQRPSEDKAGKFFRTLSTNKGAYEGFLEYLRDEAETQRRLLESVAVSALLDDSQRNIAQVQLGKVQMVNDILSYAERFTKEQKHG